jgi:hypothetical protein
MPSEIKAMPSEIKDQILAFYSKLAADQHHRYRSWEHCFSYFSRRAAFTAPEHRDTAALQLAFYLASWGMYRGSGALLWKDYRIHQRAVSELLAPTYDNLWDLCFDDAARDSATADLIVSLSDALRATYREEITTVDGTSKDFDASDTLITKVLLGTVGCTPACDRFFIDGFRQQGLSYSRFSKRFLCEVFQFCREHQDGFRETQSLITEKSGIQYPMMKLVDMYFWEIGSKLSRKNQADQGQDRA